MNFEDELRHSLADQASRIEPSPKSMARLAAASRPGRVRPAHVTLAAAALAVVLASAAVVATRSDDGRRTVSAGPDPSITTITPADGEGCPTDDAGPPSARAAAALASDGRGLVLFGGSDESGGSLGDTWLYACGRWTPLAPASAPPTGGRPLAAFDADAKVLRLVAGDGSVWSWQDGDWRMLAASGGLPKLEDAHLVYEAVAKRLLLVGGNGTALETWAWQRGKWDRLATTDGLGRLRRYGLVYHAALGKTVLFGGVYDGDMLVSGTYLWTGAAWVGTEDGGQEAPQAAVTAAYDEKAKAIVAVDDIDARTWLWDGKWTLLGVQGPGRHWEAAAAYDPSTETLVVFAGDYAAPRSTEAPRRVNDVWQWDGRSWAVAKPRP